ncbi:MAG: hypothetical protein V4487_09200 [Chlamydiota bacterium]
MKRYLFFAWIAVIGCHHSQPADPLVAIQIQDRNGLTETISTPDRLEQYNGIDYLSSQPYKKVLRVYRKEGKNHSKITTYYANGSPLQYLEAEEMRAHGAYKEWFPNGRLKIDATVIGGTADVSPGSQQDWLFDGLSQVWDEQGKLVAKIPYEKGSLEGRSVYFYPSGLIEKEFPYVKNTLEGEAFEFLPDGGLKSKRTYKNGLKDGSSQGFFANQQTAWVEEYLEGFLSKASYYNSNGDLVSQIENGGGFQAVFEKNTLLFLVEYRYGRPEGRMQKLTPQGELQISYHLKNGKKQGEEIEYFLQSEQLSEGSAPLEQPLPKLSLTWNENAIHGTVKTWYNNGRLQSQREFCRNQKQGPALAWYRDGSLMMLEDYEDGQLTRGQYYKIHQREPVSSIVHGNGIASLFDENGIFLRKVTYVKGKPIDPEN